MHASTHMYLDIPQWPLHGPLHAHNFVTLLICIIIIIMMVHLHWSQHPSIYTENQHQYLLYSPAIRAGHSVGICTQLYMFEQNKLIEGGYWSLNNFFLSLWHEVVTPISMSWDSWLGLGRFYAQTFSFLSFSYFPPRFSFQRNVYIRQKTSHEIIMMIFVQEAKQVIVTITCNCLASFTRLASC